MTRIAERSTRMRGETNALYRGRPLIIALDPHCILIRQKGRRIAYAVPYVAVFEMGARLYAIEQRRLKAEEKKRRQQARKGGAQ